MRGGGTGRFLLTGWIVALPGSCTPLKGGTTHVVANPGMASTDACLFLEGIGGVDALAWVREQNDRSLNFIEADPLCRRNHEAAL